MGVCVQHEAALMFRRADSGMLYMFHSPLETSFYACKSPAVERFIASVCCRARKTYGGSYEVG